MKRLMIGNEAVAAGALDAGVRLISSYPGTPSTEITEAIANHDPIGAKAAMVMHLNFNRSYIKKVYDGEDPDDGTIGMAAYIMDKKED